MLAKIITQYGDIVQKISLLIDISGYRNDYLAKKIGIQPSNFSVKKKRNNWDYEELSLLVPILEKSDEVQEYIDTELMAKGLSQGKDITSDEFEKRMGWK